MPQKIWRIFLTTIFGFTVISPANIAIAQPEKPPQPNTIRQQPYKIIQSGSRIKLRLPPHLGKPARRIPAASRGMVCMAANQNLTALIPESGTGLTTVANPTLYFFIPQNSAARLELVVLDENEEIIYQQKYQPSTKAGVAGIQLPPDSLAVNKNYRWIFSIICSLKDSSSNKFVEGSIQRFENPSLMKQLAQANPQNRLLIYADAGIWYDALDTVARLRYSDPRNPQFKADWEALLTAPGVEFDKKLAQAPLISAKEAPQPIENDKLGLKNSLVK